MSFTHPTLESPTQRHRRLAADLRQAPALSSDQFDVLVEDWNTLADIDRAYRAAGCRRTGHDWVASPLPGMDVCRRCVSYRPGKPAA